MDIEKLATDVPAEFHADEAIVKDAEKVIEDVKAGEFSQAVADAEQVGSDVKEAIEDGKAIAADL